METQIRRYEKYGRSEKEVYDQTIVCLGELSQEYGRSPDELLKILGGDARFGGLEEWFNKMRRKAAPHARKKRRAQRGRHPQPSRKKPDKTGEERKYVRGDAEEAVQTMPTTVTGVRPGETIMGIQNVTRAALLTLTGATIPPRSKTLETIRAFPDLWQQFLRKLGGIPFFAKIGLAERKAWLEAHEISGEIDFGGVEGACVKLVQLGKSNFLTLTDTQIEELLSGDKVYSCGRRRSFSLKPWVLCS